MDRYLMQRRWISMIDMRVDIAGIKLKNPVITASGTFGFGRRSFTTLASLGGLL
jgi:dihydroorotate dehydrogenase (NAD+) catalytic subunit